MTITLATPVINAPTASSVLQATTGFTFKGYIAHATSGTGSYTWSDDPSYPLPAGISIDPVTGYITGTPTAASGTYTVMLVAQDNYNPTPSGVGTRVFDFIIYDQDEVYIDSPVTGEYLPNASEALPYIGYQPAAYGGVGPYVWSLDITSMSLPTGMSIDSATGYISGTPAKGTAGTYSLVIDVEDTGTNMVKQVSVILEVDLINVTSKSFNVRVCAGDATTNCNTNNAPELKSGILQMYFRDAPEDDLAHFGLIDFRSPAVPAVEACIEIDVDTSSKTATSSIIESSFHTAVENAVPTTGVNYLVNGLYEAMRTYMGDPYSPQSATCDPFYDNSEGENDPQACRQNFVLMLTDGRGAASGSLVFGAADGQYDKASLPTGCDTLNSDLARNACFAYKSGDIRDWNGNASTELGATNISGIQNVSTYVVQVDPDPDNNNKDILKEATGASGGVYYGVTDPATLKDTLQQALSDIIKRAASGTAASVLASAEGKSGTLMQAVYYPRKRFAMPSDIDQEQEIAWIGRLANYWFYIDPFNQNSSMYEDTTQDQKLNLLNDNIAELYYDDLKEQVMASRWQDTNGDNIGDVQITPDIPFEQLNAIWEAGLKLWKRDLNSDPRRIYVNLNGTATGATIDSTTKLTNFTTTLTTDATVKMLLNVSTDDEAQDVIRFVHGYPENTTYYPNGYTYRSRQVQIDLNGNEQEDTDPFGTGDPTEDESVARVWKLGDILDSTPRVVHWEKVNDYDDRYGDTTYAAYNTSNQYKQRGIAFAGGNDGMLHAFKLGQILQPDQEPDPALFNALKTSGSDAAIINGTDLGHEEWAFIPLQVLPYLKYQMRNDYCHIYSVDLTTSPVDVSIGTDTAGTDAFCPAGTTDYWKCPKTVSTWRTILVGGMRLGGACKNNGSSGNIDLNDDGVVDEQDIVETPIPDYGYSSYFALDITDPENPKFMWEFTDQDLGFTLSGPAFTRMNWLYDTDGDGTVDRNADRNGRWYVIFGSGPTGPNISADLAFQNLARSDQDLKFFVLDAATGTLEGTIDTGIEKAYSGSLVETSMDFDQNYSDEHIYAGYVKYDSSTGRWNNGGIGRIETYEDMDPANWKWWPLIDNIGPVVSSPEVAVHKGVDTWVFFGTGRYFYEWKMSPDDPDAQRYVFAVQDPCKIIVSGKTGVNCQLTYDAGDPTSVTFGQLDQITSFDPATRAPHDVGWYINLYPGGTVTYEDENGTVLDTVEYKAERSITDPVFATALGAVFFTTYMPYSDGCKIGGDSFILAVDALYGTLPEFLQVQALLQSSTGSIEKVRIQGAPGNYGTLNEIIRSRRIMGVPPMAQGTTIFTNPGGEPRVLHIKER